MDSRFRGNDVYSVCALTIVIPAKAEIQFSNLRSLRRDFDATLPHRR